MPCVRCANHAWAEAASENRTTNGRFVGPGQTGEQLTAATTPPTSSSGRRVQLARSLGFSWLTSCCSLYDSGVGVGGDEICPAGVVGSATGPSVGVGFGWGTQSGH